MAPDLDKDVEIIDGDAKSEDEQRDAIAVQALERQRSAALHVQRQRRRVAAVVSSAAASGAGGGGHGASGSSSAAPRAMPTAGELKRKRADLEEDRVSKRRRMQPGAVLLDTGRTRTLATSTTLINLRPMLFLSSAMAWSTGPALGIRRGACAVARLDMRHLIVVGGNEGTNSFGSTEVLDFRDAMRMSFSPGPRMSTQRRECAAIMIDQYRLLVVGGYDGQHFLNSTEILDVRSNQFQAGPRMSARRAAPALARLGTGHIVVVGGKNTFGTLNTTEVLDVNGAAMAFMPGPSMQAQRAGPTAAVLDGSRLMVLGGHDGSRTHSSTEVLRVLDPAALPPLMVWRPGPELTTPRSYFAGVLLNAGNLHVIGGHDGYNYLNTTEVLNLTTMEFTTGPRMKRRRFMCAATAIAEDRVLVVGGSDESLDHSSTEMLSLPLYSFVPAPWMTQG